MTVASVHPDLKSLVSRRLDELGYDGRRMSYRRASEKARSKDCRISPETIRQIDVGSHSGRIEDDTVAALAAALDVSRGDILGAMHEQRSAPLGEWQPPSSANRMTLRQRRVVESVIVAFTDDREQTGTDSDRLEKNPTGRFGLPSSLSVDIAHVQQTPDRHAVLVRLGEALDSGPEVAAEILTFSEQIMDRVRRQQTGG